MFMPDQTLRVTVLHPLPATSDPEAQHDEMAFAGSRLDADGRVLIRAYEIVLVPGDFQSLDFTSADLLPHIGYYLYLNGQFDGATIDPYPHSSRCARRSAS